MTRLLERDASASIDTGLRREVGHDRYHLTSFHIFDALGFNFEEVHPLGASSTLLCSVLLNSVTIHAPLRMGPPVAYLERSVPDLPLTLVNSPVRLFTIICGERHTPALREVRRVLTHRICPS
jgi:hypothetical protein